jgi:hypothetical protein
VNQPPNTPPEPEPRHVATIDVDGRRFAVTLRTAHDGVEYVGRLWFADVSWDDAGFPDRGSLPGRSAADVLALVVRLHPDELVQRYHRAIAEKRRYYRLRRVTEEILARVRYMNHVAISMRAGLLDAEGAAQEIDLTERQLHELIKTLRHHAGVESADVPRTPE